MYCRVTHVQSVQLILTSIIPVNIAYSTDTADSRLNPLKKESRIEPSQKGVTLLHNSME